MFAFKSPDQKLMSVRMASIRMIEALRNRTEATRNVEDWRDAMEGLQVARLKKATRLRSEANAGRAEKIEKVNTWVDIKRENAKISKMERNERFMQKTAEYLGTRMGGASKRISERDAMARQISINEGVERARIIRSMSQCK